MVGWCSLLHAIPGAFNCMELFLTADSQVSTALSRANAVAGPAFEFH